MERPKCIERPEQNRAQAEFLYLVDSLTLGNGKGANKRGWYDLNGYVLAVSHFETNTDRAANLAIWRPAVTAEDGLAQVDQEVLEMYRGRWVGVCWRHYESEEHKIKPINNGTVIPRFTLAVYEAGLSNEKLVSRENAKSATRLTSGIESEHFVEETGGKLPAEDNDVLVWVRTLEKMGWLGGSSERFPFTATKAHIDARLGLLRSIDRQTWITSEWNRWAASYSSLN